VNQARTFAVVPVKRRKVHQDVAAQLEHLITTGALRDGDSLPSERVLMAEFSVGRPAIREAMLTLERAGLLRIANGQPARVQTPDTEVLLSGLTSAVRLMLRDDQGMRNFQDARAMLEIALVRRAAQQATQEQIGRIAEALRLNEQALDDSAAFERTDLAFHYEIARVSDNPIFLGLHETLAGWLLGQRTVTLRKPGASESAFAFHTRIHDAIARRDPDLAEQAMRDHLSEVEKVFWQVRHQEQGVTPQ
jgi:DNA-binding FadR family transcriptional regulator